MFRQWLGADSLILYGESYGTQYQQTYAAAHPEHVAQLLLDGAVDPQTEMLPFLAESAHGLQRRARRHAQRVRPGHRLRRRRPGHLAGRLRRGSPPSWPPGRGGTPTRPRTGRARSAD